MGTSKKQKKREWLRYRDFVLSPYGVIKIKSLGYTLTYAHAGWQGVCMLGAAVSLLALLLWWITRRVAMPE
ncbi:hypothetical protein [Symbiopectobacterium sp. RP]|uniref:hypothetical protein n=1 Tax=Symbiopectobacterium sp. RP TaxID=3248553 RepID=UPI003D29CE80